MKFEVSKDFFDKVEDAVFGVVVVKTLITRFHMTTSTKCLMKV